ncbi:MAG: DUF6644 family protein [Acidobacteriota bacterium]
MSLLSLFQWLQSTEIATALRESALVYPIVMSFHLTGMALFGGLIFLTDLRILGIAMRDTSVTDVVSQFRPWKRAGLALVAGCGIMLAWSKAEFYYHNPYFWAKMTLLTLVGVHAFAFRKSVYNNTAALDRAPVMPGSAKLAAGLSLALWIGLVSMGRLIGYYEPKP